MTCRVIAAALILAVFTQVFGDFRRVVVQDLELDVSDVPLSFDEALLSCLQRNKTLLSVDSEVKDRLLVETFVNGNETLPGTQSWIAAREVSREGAWENVVSTSTQPLYYTRWFSDQPDDIENLSCAFQHRDFHLYWRDGNCSASFYFICEGQV